MKLDVIASALAGAAIAALLLALWLNRYVRRAGALLGRVGELENRLTLVGEAVVPISTAFQKILIEELTHYHTPEMDALLQKLEPYQLTDAEAAQLELLLEQRTTDMGDQITASERDAARILPAVIRRACAETAPRDSARVIVTSVPEAKEPAAAPPATAPPDEAGRA